MRKISNTPGYNAWPMTVSANGTLLCFYCRGLHHDIGEAAMNVYCRVSRDGGRSWENEKTVSAQTQYGETSVAKGVDENGSILLLSRCFIEKTPYRHFELFRTADGTEPEKIAVIKPEIAPMQITDIQFIPGIGLAALWFDTDYNSHHHCSAWGMMQSPDNGKTWRQTVLGKDLPPDKIPQEASFVHLGDGKLLMASRMHDNEKTFQFTSTDSGKSWTSAPSNIDDMAANTPALQYDDRTGMVSCCYFMRGLGELRRRTAKADTVFQNPAAWSRPEVLASGFSKTALDSGNANMTQSGNAQIIVFYSGKAPDTAIFSVTAPAPEG